MKIEASLNDIATYYFLPNLGIKVLIDEDCPPGSVYIMPEIRIHFDDVDKLDKVEDFIKANFKKFGVITNLGG